MTMIALEQARQHLETLGLKQAVLPPLRSWTTRWTPRPTSN